MQLLNPSHPAIHRSNGLLLALSGSLLMLCSAFGCSAADGEAGDFSIGPGGATPDVGEGEHSAASAAPVGETMAASEPTDDVILESHEVASFDLGAGKSARFIHVPEQGGVIYEEVGPESTMPTFHGRDSDFESLDLFLQLAPEDSAIPRALIELADADALARIGSRPIVEAISGQMLANPSSFAADSANGNTQAATNGSLAAGTAQEASDVIQLSVPRLHSENHDAGTWNCANGQSAFESFACNGSGASEEACDSGQWYNLQRSSGGKYKKSLGIVAACGVSVEIRHRYRDCCNWWTIYDTWLPAGHWMWTRYTGAKWQRRMNYDRTLPVSGSYFRAYTAFYN